MGNDAKQLIEAVEQGTDPIDVVGSITEAKGEGAAFKKYKSKLLNLLKREKPDTLNVSFDDDGPQLSFRNRIDGYALVSLDAWFEEDMGDEMGLDPGEYVRQHGNKFLLLKDKDGSYHWVFEYMMDDEPLDDDDLGKFTTAEEAVKWALKNRHTFINKIMQ